MNQKHKEVIKTLGSMWVLGTLVIGLVAVVIVGAHFCIEYFKNHPQHAQITIGVLVAIILPLFVGCVIAPKRVGQP